MDADTQKKVQTLNAGWRQYITKILGMDDATFKLAQGSLGLQTSDSSGLFQMADGVPPNTSLYDAGSTKSFASSYTQLLLALLPETGTTLQQALGNNYSNWITFRDGFFAANPTTADSQFDVFTRFANQRLDPRTAQSCISAFKAAAQTPLNQAFDANISNKNAQVFTDSAGQQMTLKRYTPTSDSVISALNGSTGLKINFDSESVESTLSQTTVDAAASGFYDIFSGGASGGFDQLNTKAASSGFSIVGAINKYTTMVVKAGAWFTAGEYGRAYTAKNDNTVWDPQANSGDWSSFFDPNTGSLARRVSQLLLVSDYSLTVTSKATYSQQDLLKIKAEASFGIWPFFSTKVTTTHTTETRLNSASQLETTFTLNKGLYQIWGVNTLSAPA